MKVLSQAKLFDLLSVFEAREWRMLGRTETVAGNVRLASFYTFLDTYYPDFKNITFDRKDVFKSIFPGLPFDDKKLRYLFSDFQEAAEVLLTTRALQSEPATGKRLLSTELARRGAGKNYLSHYNKDAETGSGDAPGSSDRFFSEFSREETHLLHYLPQRPRGETNIAATVRCLDLFYLVKKLQLLCEMVNVRNVLAVHHETTLSDEISSALQKGAYTDVPAVTAWYRVWLTLTEPDKETHFFALRDTLLASKQEFPKKELRDLYQYLMNYCIRRINTGDTAYVSTLLSIYKVLLTDGILFNGDEISQWDYKNITAIGIRAGEPEWTIGFIEEFRQKLPPAERDNAYLYNLAYYHFNTGQRSRALSMLQMVEFNDLYYQLDSRVILLKCYFENGDEDAFFYHASAFRLFLARNKQVSAYQRTVYRNLLKFTTRILRANGDRKKLDTIREEVERGRNVADIGWVLKQLVIGK